MSAPQGIRTRHRTLTPTPEVTTTVQREAEVLAEGFGHAKVILLGEHAVVYGEPAIAGSLAAGVQAFARPGCGRLSVPAWGLAVTAEGGRSLDPTEPASSPQTMVARALAAIIERVGGWDLDFRVATDIPARAGLGSSAALAAALARAAATVHGADEAAVRAAVDAAEAVFHGTPSGIDAAAALGGGVGRFQRPEGWTALPLAEPLSICIGFSSEPRQTRHLVKHVRDLQEGSQVPGKIIRLMGELVGEAEAALRTGDLPALGRQFNMAHGLLSTLGVSSAGLDALVHGARDAGALGAKLTGAGGGGAVVALAPQHENEVLARWRSLGYTGFATRLGTRSA